MSSGSPINQRFLHKVSAALFKEANEQETFEKSFLGPTTSEKAVVWMNERARVFEALSPWPEQPEFVDRVPELAAPGKHPLHDQGAFYVLDYSSVFATVPLREIRVPIAMVVDVCAAPGGKSILASRTLRPQRLIANEVISKRAGALISNLRRLKLSHAEVVTRDPSQLEEIYRGQAQLVLVDAPCSGQSLLLKGQKSPGCFNPIQIEHNSKRQKRIIAHSGGIVEPGGYLLYTTCTFSLEENEEVVDWFLKKFSDFEAVEVPNLLEFRSQLTSAPCYRLFPFHGRGAGAFTALFKKKN